MKLYSGYFLLKLMLSPAIELFAQLSCYDDIQHSLRVKLDKEGSISPPLTCIFSAMNFIKDICLSNLTGKLSHVYLPVANYITKYAKYKMKWHGITNMWLSALERALLLKMS